jgi:hypothetical protein
MAGVAITRTDMSAANLRAAAKQSADGRQASRILAIAMVVDRQTLRFFERLEALQNELDFVSYRLHGFNLI